MYSQWSDYMFIWVVFANNRLIVRSIPPVLIWFKILSDYMIHFLSDYFLGDFTVFANCLNTIGTCLDQRNTTWSFGNYTLNTCNHTLNKSAALHFSCNWATHLLLSSTYLLLHTISYIRHYIQKWNLSIPLGILKNERKLKSIENTKHIG